MTTAPTMIVVWFLAICSPVLGWCPTTTPFSKRRCASSTALHNHKDDEPPSPPRRTDPFWKETDNWSALLEGEEELRMSNYLEKITNKSPREIAMMNARELERLQKHRNRNVTAELSEEDQFVSDTIETIHHTGFLVYEPQPGDPALYDTPRSLKNADQVAFEDEMGNQISMLVRCNEHPDEFLVQQGRKLPPLTPEMVNNATQLVTSPEPGTYKMTPFFRQATLSMFQQHAAEGKMDASCVSKWMTTALGAFVGQHDRRITKTISKFGEYGTGYLTLPNFEALYLEAVRFALENPTLDKKDGTPTVASVFRDLRNHGIATPIEIEREFAQREIEAKYGGTGNKDDMVALTKDQLDECEIVHYSEEAASPENRRKANYAMESSHLSVELANDGKTPLWLRDGDFIFIDEESCIGCQQCVNHSPDSFLMLEDGRARTFQQRRCVGDVVLALEACPVNCMHRVSFDELKELEEHRGSNLAQYYTGKAPIPLHVARRDSDQNRQSSWYHKLKHKCAMSSSCPSRGCYACPQYSQPGDSPYWKARHRQAEHVRAETMVERGYAERFRKATEL